MPELAAAPIWMDRTPSAKSDSDVNHHGQKLASTILELMLVWVVMRFGQPDNARGGRIRWVRRGTKEAIDGFADLR